MKVNVGRFGRNFRSALDEKGISQHKLSEVAGIHPMTVNAWATGKALPCAEYLALIAISLGVTIDELMKDVVKE